MPPYLPSATAVGIGPSWVGSGCESAEPRSAAFRTHWRLRYGVRLTVRSKRMLAMLLRLKDDLRVGDGRRVIRLAN
jgi:hypothetical protein